MTPDKDVDAQKDEYIDSKSNSGMHEAGDLASTTFDSPKKTAQMFENHTKPVVPVQPRGPPADVNMNIPPAANNKSWNLSGHVPNDRSKNMITPDEWYNFGRNAFKDVEAEQKAKGTNVDRLVKDNGGFDAKDNGKFTKK